MEYLGEERKLEAKELELLFKFAEVRADGTVLLRIISPRLRRTEISAREEEGSSDR